jgi:hypothetical protein
MQRLLLARKPLTHWQTRWPACRWRHLLRRHALLPSRLLKGPFLASR